MQLVNLALTNFKSYKDKESIENLQGISVFIGPNNVGKSNIIKSLLWYQELGFRRYNQGIAVNFEIKRLFHTGATTSPLTLEIVFELDSYERNKLLEMLPYSSENVRNDGFSSTVDNESLG